MSTVHVFDSLENYGRIWMHSNNMDAERFSLVDLEAVGLK